MGLILFAMILFSFIYNVRQILDKRKKSKLDKLKGVEYTEEL